MANAAELVRDLFKQLKSPNANRENVLLIGQDALTKAKEHLELLTTASANAEEILEAEIVVLSLQAIVDLCAL
ncbi:hypothetical protein N7509_012901 [Penicillium cosmopolitanum]|uniref:Uncharacterized protein n=1 Tax=Penicillium cosmopolitanum TaxID=1131564 RepID=A0A9W9VDZ1_9EURO|nr:uncharacterized protein N7509_012901 [Penicillium cosmopolitanum]KAJ5376015.1 hypothetical protein N7509_012901 [Penicillium cosmopolitanum]